MPDRKALKEKAFSERYAIANLRRMGAYCLELAEKQELQMSERGQRENTLLNRLAAADAKVVELTTAAAEKDTALATSQAQVADLTNQLAAANAKVPDAFDNQVDARAAAILAGQADPGDPGATGETPPPVAV